ncbi:MAG: filamentous hemagglutinin N-terminal domain-containing protein [Parachlamydiales bacterium]|nr:filamentous hemagglutinin N-terminal domain-containing protein [Parachlamydiales bacterium]
MRWLLYAIAVPCFSLPTGAVFVQGQGELRSTDPLQMEVQAADRSIIHWEAFDVAAPESVIFSLPSADCALLNRVLGNARSEIFGKISSNGQIILLNPNGIFVGKEACIDTAGWIAATFDLQDKTFLQSKEWQFAGSSQKPIEIEGTIRAPKISLFGDNISLSGSLKGESIFVGGSREGKDVLIQNASFVTISPSAEIETIRDGQAIFFSKGDLDFGGHVYSPNGFVEVSAKQNLAFHGLVDTDKTGTLLLDPNQIDIVLGGAGTTIPAPFAAFYNGSPAVSATVASADLINQLGLTNVTIQTNSSIPGGSGNITLHPGATITWASGTNLTLQADQSILIYDLIHSTAPNSQIALFANQGDIVITSDFGGSGAQAQIIVEEFHPVGFPSIILQAPNGSLTMIAANNLETKVRSNDPASSGDIHIAAQSLNFTAAAALAADANAGIQNGRGDIYVNVTGPLNFTSGTGNAPNQANANIVTGLSGMVPTGGNLYFSVGSLNFNSSSSITGVQGAASLTAYGSSMGAGFGNVTGTVFGDALFQSGYPIANGSGISSLFSGNIDVAIRGNLTMISNSGPSIAFCGTGIQTLFTLSGATADVNVAIGGNLIAISGGGMDSGAGFGATGNLSVAVAGSAIFQVTNGTAGGQSGNVIFSRAGSVDFAARTVSFIGNNGTPLPVVIQAQNNITFATIGDLTLNFGSLIATTGNITLRSGGSIHLQTGTSLQANQQILAIADRNIEMLNSSANSTTDRIIFVVDNAFPVKPLIGSGAFITNPSTLTAPLGISIYTAQRARNSIQSTTFNGATFVPGTLFVNTTEEIWCTYYPNGLTTFPFTIFYKDCENLVAYQANLIGSELFRDLHPYDEAWGWYERFTLADDERTEPHMIRRRNLMFDLPKSWTKIVNHP